MNSTWGYRRILCNIEVNLGDIWKEIVCIWCMFKYPAVIISMIGFHLHRIRWVQSILGSGFQWGCYVIVFILAGVGLWNGAVWKIGGVEEWNGSGYGMDRQKFKSLNLLNLIFWMLEGSGGCFRRQWALVEVISFECQWISESSMGHHSLVQWPILLVSSLFLLLLLFLPPPLHPHHLEGFKGRMRCFMLIYCNRGILLEIHLVSMKLVWK